MTACDPEADGVVTHAIKVFLMTSDDRYRQFIMRHENGILTFYDPSSQTVPPEETKGAKKTSVIQHDLQKVRIVSLDSRDFKMTCRKKRHFCLILKNSETKANRKLYFMTYSQMLDGAMYISAAQGFKRRVD